MVSRTHVAFCNKVVRGEAKESGFESAMREGKGADERGKGMAEMSASGVGVEQGEGKDTKRD